MFAPDERLGIFIIPQVRQGARHAVYSFGFVLPEGLGGRRLSRQAVRIGANILSLDPSNLGQAQPQKDRIAGKYSKEKSDNCSYDWKSSEAEYPSIPQGKL